MTQTHEKRCGCGAPYAADQRYCLNCGERCGERRIDFGQYRAEPGPPSDLVPAEQPERPPQRDYTPLAAVGGIAVLGMMLLVGVLIGRGDGDQAAPPPPQIVRVQDGGEEAATIDGEGALGGAAKKTTKGKGAAKGGVPTAGSAKPPPAEITASDSELEALQEKSPQEYSEASAKLPDEIATPGEAPPVDGKAPGGGSEGTAIE